MKGHRIDRRVQQMEACGLRDRDSMSISKEIWQPGNVFAQKTIGSGNDPLLLRIVWWRIGEYF